MEDSKKIRRFPQTVTVAYEYLLLTVLLFYFDGNGYGGIMQAKAGAFFLLGGGYVVLMAVWGAVRVCMGGTACLRLPELVKRSTWPQRLVVLYLVITWISAVCSPFWPVTLLGATRFEGALSITLYCVSFLLVNIYGRADRKLLALLGISASVFSVLCLAQLMGANPLGLYPAGYNYHDAGTAYLGAYLGTIGNVDLVAAFYCLTIPILVYALVRLRGRGRFLLFIPLVLSLWVVVWMQVSAGLLGVLGGCLAAIPVAGFTNPKKRKIAALVLAGLVLAGLCVLFFVDFGTGTLHEAHSLLHGKAEATFGSGRLHIWSEVLKKIPEHPWLGAGPDTMSHGGLEPFRRYDSRLGGNIVAKIDTAHNEYLNILYHQGIFALAAFLALLAGLVRRWVTHAPRDAAAAILGAGCLGYGIQAFFGIGMCVTELFFLVILALLAGTEKQESCPIS